MKVTPFLPIALSCVLSFFSASAWAAEIPQAVIDSAQKRVDYALNPAIVIVYVEGQDAPVIRAFGKQSLAADALPVTAQSRFEIGSVSKVFTALMYADMQVEPKTVLSSLWPAGWPDLHQSMAHVPLKNLLTHTSGLPRLPDNFNPQDPTDPYADYDNKAFGEFFKTYSLKKTPAPYGYSNLVYGLLGALMVPLTDSESYNEVLQSHITQPLGMQLTSTEDLENLRLSTQAHFDGTPVSAWHFSEVTAGAGAIRSNGEDMAKFIAAQVNPPDTELGDAIRRSHTILHTESKQNRTLELAYAWHVADIKGRRIYTHNGQTGGYLSFVGFDPKSKKGAVVLSNNTDSIEDLGVALLNPDYQLQDVPDQRRPEQSLKPYEGKYQLAPGMVLAVTQNAGYLIVQLTGQPAFRVMPDGKHRFKLRVVEAALEFEMSEGSASAVVLHQNGKHHAPRIKD